MVIHVADDDVEQGARADRVAIRGSPTFPAGRRRSAHEPDGGISHGNPIRQELVEWPPIDTGGSHVDVLIESRQRSLIAAGNSKEPIAEDSFHVRHVADDFPDAPFVRGVAKTRLRVRNGGQKGRHSVALRGQIANRIGTVSNASDVACVERGVFIGLWTWNLDHGFANRRSGDQETILNRRIGDQKILYSV